MAGDAAAAAGAEGAGAGGARRGSFQQLYGAHSDPAAEATRAHYAARANEKITGYLPAQDADNYLAFVASSTTPSNGDVAAEAAAMAAAAQAVSDAEAKKIAELEAMMADMKAQMAAAAGGAGV